jgi:hypothetical protein
MYKTVHFLGLLYICFLELTGARCLIACQNALGGRRLGDGWCVAHALAPLTGESNAEPITANSGV